jgi:CheY-like chemotaxis protein
MERGASSMSAKNFILFAEDDSNEVELIRAACDRADLPETSYRIVRDGLQAISFLESTVAIPSSGPRPTHVFTDVEMPLYDGLRLLWWIRTHPEFKQIRVTVLTNQASDEIRARATRLGCDEFFQKPSNFDELVLLVGRAAVKVAAPASA